LGDKRHEINVVSVETPPPLAPSHVNDFAWSYFGLQASRSKQPFAMASLGDICPRR